MISAEGTASTPEFSIELVGSKDLVDLLPLIRAYCDFYKASPTDQGLLALATALIDDPQREGLQLMARDFAGERNGMREK